MAKADLPDEIVQLLLSVTAKRPRTVINHILEHGYITTEELELLYGYKHPPRAARDVRELGIPLETFQSKNIEGKTIAGYRFGDFSKIEARKLGGRRIFPKSLKRSLLEKQEGRCAVCGETYAEQYFQIDHRIPYEIAGDTQTEDIQLEDFMLLCSSCNRSKSWICEQCENWKTAKIPDTCLTCAWANPLHYEHIALRHIRRVEIVWSADSFDTYEQLQKQASDANLTISAYIKLLLQKYLSSSK